MKPEQQYHYADGSANKYILTATSLEYLPVTPEESSTGTYSGGDPAFVEITAEQFNTLKGLFETAIAKTEIHTDSRDKMTGLIIRTAPSGSTRVILLPGVPEMLAIEKALKATLAQ